MRPVRTSRSCGGVRTDPLMRTMRPSAISRTAFDSCGSEVVARAARAPATRMTPIRSVLIDVQGRRRVRKTAKALHTAAKNSHATVLIEWESRPATEPMHQASAMAGRRPLCAPQATDIRRLEAEAAFGSILMRRLRRPRFMFAHHLQRNVSARCESLRVMCKRAVQMGDLPMNPISLAIDLGLRSAAFGGRRSNTPGCRSRHR